MSAPQHRASPRPRRRAGDRRHGIDQVLREVVAHLHGPAPALRASLQQAAARAYHFEEVRIAESAPACGVREFSCDGSAWRHEIAGGGNVRCEPAAGEPDGWDRDEMRALANVAALVLEVDRLRAAPSRARTPRAQPVLVGSSAEMESVRARVAQVARSSCRVLIQGESGVGKEVVARLIHEGSRRARGPFVAVNCAAIVETLLEAELFGIEDRTATGVRGRRGKFEQADGGTLFLDEIGDLAPTAQAKLLRVLQDLTVERVGRHTAIPVDVRVLAATNRNLATLVAEGRFRADLYYRLNGVEVDVPPLRTHRGDVPELVAHVLARHQEVDHAHVSPAAVSALCDYQWPGNVRELEHVVERALALSPDGVITPEHLPPGIAKVHQRLFAPALEESLTLRAFAARYVRMVVEQSGNRRVACRVLDISYHTLRAYLRDPDEQIAFRRGPRLAPAEAPRRVAVAADRPARGFDGAPRAAPGCVP